MKGLVFVACCLLLVGCATGPAVLSQPPNAEEIAAAGSAPIAVSGIYAARNSANGIDILITWKNISDKPIKYCYMAVAAVNAVGDIVPCQISRKPFTKLEFTGPYEAGAIAWGGYGSSKGYKISFHPTAIYHPNATKIIIQKVWVKYMDDTKSPVFDTVDWPSTTGDIGKKITAADLR